MGMRGGGAGTPITPVTMVQRSQDHIKQAAKWRKWVCVCSGEHFWPVSTRHVTTVIYISDDTQFYGDIALVNMCHGPILIIVIIILKSRGISNRTWLLASIT